ncbi:glutathione S-transferase family protein [Archangium lipolyticum]|uniref:glutathione S-transferase family protein n=1 Tax=Archangium lipolyticum TaxID=2970465 RepID=UPI00214A4BF3|nr:glutathione S-transferase family protein [Archangium lipolyticum]
MPRISSEVKNHFGYISGALAERDYLVGNSFSAADIQMSFVLEAARLTGAQEVFQSLPNLGTYLERLHARPAHQRALQRGRLGDTGGQDKRQRLTRPHLEGRPSQVHRTSAPLEPLEPPG